MWLDEAIQKGLVAGRVRLILRSNLLLDECVNHGDTP